MTRSDPAIISVRLARASDIDVLVSLLQELFGIEKDFNGDPEKQRKGLELLLARPDGAYVFVAEHNDRVIAMCSLQRMVSTAEGNFVGLVEDLIVDRSFRGRAVGRALLSALETQAQALGLSRLQLLADRTNKAALDFYDRNGWMKTELIGLRKFVMNSTGV